MNDNVKKTITIIVSSILTIFLLTILLKTISITEIITTLKNIPLTDLGIILILYGIAQLFRSIRTWMLIQKTVPLKEVFSITCIHAALVNIMPARTGEIGYVYLLKKTGKVNTGTGIGTLAIARLFDIIAIAILFFIASMTATNIPPLAQQLKIPVIISLSTIILLVITILMNGDKTVSITRKIFETLNVQHMRPTQWILQKIQEAIQNLKNIQHKTILKTIICSLITWTSLFSISHILLKSIMTTAPQISLTILATSMVALLSGLPIQGIIGLGTIETFWTAALVGIGIPIQTAILAGFIQHIISILSTTIFGIYGLLMIVIIKKTKQCTGGINNGNH